MVFVPGRHHRSRVERPQGYDNLKVSGRSRTPHVPHFVFVNVKESSQNVYVSKED